MNEYDPREELRKLNEAGKKHTKEWYQHYYNAYYGVHTYRGKALRGAIEPFL